MFTKATVIDKNTVKSNTVKYYHVNSIRCHMILQEAFSYAELVLKNYDIFYKFLRFFDE